MNRRSLLLGAAALLAAEPLVRRTYSFAGGWALPEDFVELESGLVVPLRLEQVAKHPIWLFKTQYHTLNFPNGVMEYSAGIPVGDSVRRIRTGNIEAWYEHGCVTETNFRPAEHPMPIVSLRAEVEVRSVLTAGNGTQIRGSHRFVNTQLARPDKGATILGSARLL